MSEWCLEHPIATFVLVLAALNCVSIKIHWQRKRRSDP